MAIDSGIRAVLFDATDTLIELREPVGETYARLARRHGVALPAWRVEDAFGRVLRRAPPMVFPDARPGEVEGREREWWRQTVRATFRAADSTARFANFDAYFDEVYRVFSDPETWSCRPGAAELLCGLRRRGLKTGVVSNFDRRLLELLAGLELSPLLDVVVLPSDAGAAKPDLRIFALALERLGTPACAAVFVGDCAERDVAGARAAGMRSIDARGLATLRALPGLLEDLKSNHREPAR